EMSSNYPIIRLVDADNKIHYSRTFNWTSTGVATGILPVATQFTLPPGVSFSNSALYVVANGISSAPFITGAVASHFAISAPASGAAGSPFSVIVTARDPSNNIAPSYGGVVHFSSTDSTASLPADVTLEGGVGTFSVMLRSAGGMTITATDTFSSRVLGNSG